jgi:hypothetical protein
VGRDNAASPSSIARSAPLPLCAFAPLRRCPCAPSLTGATIHGREWFKNAGGHLQYKLFMSQVDRNFILRADGRPDVQCRLSMSFVTSGSDSLREFEVLVPPGEYAKMSIGVAYTLRPVNAVQDHQWKVRNGLTFNRE